MIYLILFIIGWLVSGFIAYGLDFAEFQGRYPSIAKFELPSDRLFALWVALFGYIGLISTISNQLIWDGKIGKHGFKIF